MYDRQYQIHAQNWQKTKRKHRPGLLHTNAATSVSATNASITSVVSHRLSCVQVTCECGAAGGHLEHALELVQRPEQERRAARTETTLVPVKFEPCQGGDRAKAVADGEAGDGPDGQQDDALRRSGAKRHVASAPGR